MAVWVVVVDFCQDGWCGFMKETCLSILSILSIGSIQALFLAHAEQNTRRTQSPENYLDSISRLQAGTRHIANVTVLDG